MTTTAIERAAREADRRVDESHARARTQTDWDGFFTARCVCGRDVTWRAYPGRPKPICTCQPRQRRKR